MEIKRYPGVISFQDDEVSSHLFFGRDDESKQLFYHILSEHLIVLFSKSGHGKTSILQARIFKQLRNENFCPIPIRFNKRDVSPQQMIEHEILNAATQNEIQEVLIKSNIDGPEEFEEGRPDSNTIVKTKPQKISATDRNDNLSNFLANIEIWTKTDQLLTPVLIFDQFEEIFTLEHNLTYRRDFFAELADVVNKAKDGKLPVKVVISIREDFLGYLESLAVKIPSIFTNRFRLEPLKKSNAEQAIVAPAALEKIDQLPDVQFSSKPFCFSADAKKELLDFLSLKLIQGNWIPSEEVEPIQLQIICCELEDRVINSKIKQNKQGKIEIGTKDLNGAEGVKEILSGFYFKQLEKVSNDLKLQENELDEVRDIIERKLIVGKRRVPIDYDAVTQAPKIREAVDILIENKLIKKDGYRANFLIELSHDTLIEPILSAFAIRKAIEDENTLRKNRRKLAKSRLLIGLLVILLLACTILGLYSWTRYRQVLSDKHLMNIQDSLMKVKEKEVVNTKIQAVKAEVLAVQSSNQVKKEKQQKYLITGLNVRKENPTMAYKIIRNAYLVDTTNFKTKSIYLNFKKGKYAFIENASKVHGSVISAYLSNKSIFAFGRSNEYRFNDAGILEYMYSFKNMAPDGINLCTSRVGNNFYSIINSSDGKASIIDNKAKVISIFNDVDSAAQEGAISHSGKLFVIGRYLYKTGNKDTLPNFHLPSLKGAMSVIFSADDRYVISGHWTSHIVIQNLKGTIIKVFKHGATNSVVNAVAVTSNMKYLVSASRDDRNLKIWNIGKLGGQDLNIEEKFLYELKGHVASVNCVAISPDNKYILSGSDDNTAILWNFKGERIAILKGSKSKITAVGFSADGREMITGSENGEIIMWKIGDPEQLERFHRLADYSKFDYSSNNLLELNINEKQKGNRLKNLYLSTLNYINSVPEINQYPEDYNYNQSLRIALKQCDSMYAKLIRDKHFKDSINISAQKLLYNNYAQLRLDKPDLLLQTYQKNNYYTYTRYADRDIIAGKAALLGSGDLNDGLFYAEDISNVVGSLITSKNYPLALNYALAGKSLSEQLSLKSGTNTDSRIREQLYDAYRDLARAYLYNYKYNRMNVSKAQSYAQKALITREDKNHGFANSYLIAANLLINRYDDAIAVYKRSKTIHNKKDFEELKTVIVNTLNDMIRMTNNINLRNFKKYIDSEN